MTCTLPKHTVAKSCVAYRKTAITSVISSTVHMRILSSCYMTHWVCVCVCVCVFVRLLEGRDNCSKGRKGQPETENSEYEHLATGH